MSKQKQYYCKKSTNYRTGELILLADCTVITALCKTLPHYIWVVACDFQQGGILTCVLGRAWSDCTYVQADLRLCWWHIPQCWKFHALAHISVQHNSFTTHTAVYQHNAFTTHSRTTYHCIAWQWFYHPSLVQQTIVYQHNGFTTHP